MFGRSKPQNWRWAGSEGAGGDREEAPGDASANKNERRHQTLS